jgi:hypothetical protein
MNLDFNLSAINSGLYNYIHNMAGKSPLMLVTIIVLIVGYSMTSPYLGGIREEEFVMFDKSSDIFEVLLWTIFLFLVLLNGVYFFFGININTSVKNLFSGKVLEVDLDVNEESETGKMNKNTIDKVLSDFNLFSEKRLNTEEETEETEETEEKEEKKGKKETKEKEESNKIKKIKGIMDRERETIKLEDDVLKSSRLSEYNSGKEVFHIPSNKYTYKDAQSVCKAYGARLANYDEIENSYNKGGEWCSYGWSANQLALFPTQKSTYNKLQKEEGHEHDCGRPGVNGGFINNEDVRFGINCFGFKPKMKPEDKQRMEKQHIYPKTEKDYKLERTVDKWRNKLPDILVAPFNSNTWSRV